MGGDTSEIRGTGDMLVYRELTRAMDDGKPSKWGRKMEEMAGPVFGIVKVLIWLLASRLLALRFFPVFRA